MSELYLVLFDLLKEKVYNVLLGLCLCKWPIFKISSSK